MQLKHLTTIQDLSREQIEVIFKRAESLKSKSSEALRARATHGFIGNLFFEPSTRTRLSFETAAKSLGLDVLTMNEANSSRVKGETYLDTLLTLEAMGCKAFVIRTKEDFISMDLVTALHHIRPDVHIINAGGGTLNHPTQGLLDVFTMLQHFPDLESRKICIVGDIKHSRVARSTVQTLNQLGIHSVHLVAPAALLPESDEFLSCSIGSDLSSGLSGADVVMTLRIQKERMHASDIPSQDEYHQTFGLNSENIQLANSGAIVMHPGPTNRGVEISGELADSSQSVITQQVANGVLIRMALLDIMLNDAPLK